VPGLKGRLELFTFTSDSAASFVNGDVARELLFTVKKMLTLP
jgi:hypothetical protein